MLDGADVTQPSTYVYPEWDERRRVYLADWCRVVEDVAEADPGSRPMLPGGAALRPALARLGTGLVPCRRRRQGDDPDLEAMVEARVGRITGAPRVEEV